MGGRADVKGVGVEEPEAVEVVPGGGAVVVVEVTVVVNTGVATACIGTQVVSANMCTTITINRKSN